MRWMTAMAATAFWRPPTSSSLADIKGMEVGMNEGSVSQFWFNILLKQAGMTEADVKITNMTADDAAAAFMADRIPVADHLGAASDARQEGQEGQGADRFLQDAGPDRRCGRR